MGAAMEGGCGGHHCNKASENCQHVSTEWSTMVSGVHHGENSGAYDFPDYVDADPGKACAPILATHKSKVVLEGGAIYEGSWAGSVRQGEGTLTLPDGATYVGQFHEDRKDGYGVYCYPSGSSYSGQWSDDFQTGQGEERWPDGSIFQGHFRNGEKQGPGKFTWASNCRYEGEFDHNDMHGDGVYHWSDGRGYSGQWVRNAMSLKGSMWWADGRRYEGEFFDGRKHGKGILRWTDSRYYTGQWFEGRQHGVGIACNNRGVKRESRWFEGTFVEWGDEVAGGEVLSDEDATRHPLFDRLQTEAYLGPALPTPVVFSSADVSAWGPPSSTPCSSTAPAAGDSSGGPALPVCAPSEEGYCSAPSDLSTG